MPCDWPCRARPRQHNVNVGAALRWRGSAAYAVAELMQWRSGLDKQWAAARGFHSILLGAKLLGTSLDFTPLDPVKALL
jgi:hypothetical protein